jgi:hypothetical protein
MLEAAIEKCKNKACVVRGVVAKPRLELLDSRLTRGLM